MLIVCTDHGFLLGEHDWWAKNKQPWYQELAHTPLFIWDPRSRVAGERRASLTQMIDLPATLLEYFGLDRPPAMQGQPLRQAIAADAPGGALWHPRRACQLHDGKYVYMRAPG